MPPHRRTGTCTFRCLASNVQQYGGNTDEVWSRFLTELANLPEDIGKRLRAIDGYRRVFDAWRGGRWPRN